MLRWHFNTAYLSNDNSHVVLTPTSKIIVQDTKLVLTTPERVLPLGHKSLLGEDILTLSDISLSDRVSKLLHNSNVGALVPLELFTDLGNYLVITEAKWLVNSVIRKKEAINLKPSSISNHLKWINNTVYLVRKSNRWTVNKDINNLTVRYPTVIFPKLEYFTGSKYVHILASPTEVNNLIIQGNTTPRLPTTFNPVKETIDLVIC